MWRAEYLALRSPVAVKLIDPEIAGRPETLERFQAEAWHLRQLVPDREASS